MAQDVPERKEVGGLDLLNAKKAAGWPPFSMPDSDYCCDTSL
jgi:hypothetical protein